MGIRFNSRLRPAGYTIVTPRDGGPVIEADTLMCAHCGMHFPRKKAIWTPLKQTGIRRGFCFRCNGPLCGLDRCMVCIPTEKRVDLAERGADLATIHLRADALAVTVGSLWQPWFSKQ